MFVLSKKTGLLSLVFSLVAGSVLAAPDEEALGKWQDYPVCNAFDGAQLAQRCLVGLYSNWDKLAATHKIARGETVAPLKRAPLEPPIAYKHRDTAVPGVDDFLSRHRNTGLLILSGNTILYERYQYDRKPEHLFHSFSMAKTVVAMLVGIALQEGKIGSIDDLAEKYVPALHGTPYGATSLRHLLTMSSGIRFTEEYSGADDVSRLSLKTYGRKGPGGADTVSEFRTREAPAGTRFKYVSADTQVLGLALRAAVGMPLADYLSRKVWQPMGAEADATWHLDPGGNELGFSGINATLRDWGRLGLLLANDGALNGKQIVPADWVRAMTTAEAPYLRVGVATRFNGYGYQTWLIDPGKRHFALLGVRGQAVFVDPESKTVVVHTAVHATQRDLASRAEQFSLFYGVLNYTKQTS
jgi:CubicO group peptidase (beta-lactamase class C family)